jgi:hypothetical protein
MPQICDMGQAASLPLRRKACCGFFRPKNPTAAARIEPAILGTRGQHANYLITEAANIHPVGLSRFWHRRLKTILAPEPSVTFGWPWLSNDEYRINKHLPGDVCITALNRLTPQYSICLLWSIWQKRWVSGGMGLNVRFCWTKVYQLWNT